MSDTVLRKNIINLREERNWSQRQLAKYLKMDNTALNRIEKGTRKVTSDELETLSNVFNVSTDYLLGRTQIKQPESTDLDDVMSIDGKPLDEHDRKLLKDIARSIQKNKE